jgi:CheY-like chemotaxis protein
MSGSAADPKTILVIEDDALFREGLTIILQREGYQVVATVNGREARDKLQDGTHPDLILLDMMLPVEDGWRLLDWRRQKPALASVPVVVVTGIRIGSPEWAASLGACGFLRKPVEVERLLAEVKRCCR